PGKEISEKRRGVRNLAKWQTLRFHRQYPGQRVFIHRWTKAVIAWSTPSIVQTSAVVQMSETASGCKSSDVGMSAQCPARAPEEQARCSLLLLLFLRRVFGGRRGWLLRLFDQYGPLFRNRKYLIELGSFRRSGHPHGYGQVTGSMSAKDSPGRGHVSIVAADGGTNVAVARQQAIG